MSVMGVEVGLVGAKLLGDICSLYLVDVGLFIEPGAVGTFEVVEFDCPLRSFGAVVYLKKL